MTIGMIVNGTLFGRVKEIQVSRSIRDFVGWFSFVSSADANSALPVRANDSVQIVANQQGVLLTGFIESISVRQSANEHEISGGGRDKTADLLDSSLRTKEFNGPIRFVDLVSRVLSEQGLSYQVIDQTGGIENIRDDELVSGEIGQGAFDFLETYARRVQAVMTTNALGQIVLVRSDGATQSQRGLIRQTGNPQSNILQSEVSIDWSRRYRNYTVQSQLSSAGSSDFSFSVEQSTNQSGSAFDRQARPGRFLEIEAETSMDSITASRRAALQSNLRRADSLQYTATVQGDGVGFSLNSIVDVQDDFCGIDSAMLVTDIKTSFGVNYGTVTTIGMTYSDAISLSEEQSRVDQSRQKTGNDFSFDFDSIR